MLFTRLLAVCLMTVASPNVLAFPADRTARSPIPLEPMSLADAEKTETIGTGCAWSNLAGRRWRISMADDRAAVRIGGQFVILKPARGAKDLFPFTFDRWTDGKITIAIRKTGNAARRGSEAVENRASLLLTRNGSTHSWMGRLNCGS